MNINKKSLLLFSFLLGIIFFISMINAYNFIGGDGSDLNPYQINNWSALDAVRNNLTTNYVMIFNISSLTSDYLGIGDNFNPIGGTFTGNFYGNTNSIKDLIINKPTSNNVGLFSISSGNISDINLINISIIGQGSPGQGVGSLVGRLDNSGKIIGCSASGIISGVNTIGGLVGYGNSGWIYNSYSNVNITGSTNLGGLVGYSWITIQGCYSTGNITGSSNFVGGLIGFHNGGLVNSSYATGNVIAGSYGGGFVGREDGGSIANSYALGNSTASIFVGGFIGVQVHGNINTSYSIGTSIGTASGGFGGVVQGSVNNSYWDNETSGQSTSGGQAVGKTTVQMKNISTFINWDFNNIWNITEGVTYPYLINSYNATIKQIPWSCYIYSMNGDGSINNPCQITNWSQLNSVRENLTASYILINNLSSNDADYNGIGNSWIPIGQAGNAFNGNFNGNNNIISNLKINRPSQDYNGLFGRANSNISNLGLINVNITGEYFTGSIVGYLENGTIENVYSNGTINSQADNIGGLIGKQIDGKINKCYSKNEIQGDSYIGGLVGFKSAGIIKQSYATGKVNSLGGQYVGGLVGEHDTGLIENSYATGNTSGDIGIGGLVGYNLGLINNSYSNGKVTINVFVGGGLVGDGAGSVINSFYDLNTSGQSDTGKGEPKNTNQMINISTFSNWSISYSALNINNQYPYLAWQNNTNNSIWLILERLPPNATIIPNDTFTSNTPVNFTLNASDPSGLANVTIFISNETYDRKTIKLNKGINYFGAIFNESNTGTNMNRTIIIINGLNLIGISNRSDISLDSVIFSNGTDYNYSVAKSLGLIKSINDTNGSEATVLQGQKAYWVYSNFNLNMTLVDVGGVEVGDSFDWRNIYFSNGYQKLNITDARIAGWIENYIYYWNPTYVDAFGNVGRYERVELQSPSRLVKSWNGYHITSNINNLQMIFDEQLTYVNQTTINSPSNGIISISIDLLHGIYQYFWNLFDTLGNFFITNTQNVGVDFQNITNCQELQNMQYNLTANYQLINNIDCSDTKYWNNGAGFKEIGKWTKEFTGKIEGNNFNITDIYANNYSSAGNNEISVFGRTKNAEIKNVNIINANMSGYASGILFSYAVDTSIINCHVNGNLRTNTSSGGLGISLISTYKNLTQIVNSSSIVIINSEQNSSYRSFGGLVGSAVCTPIGLGSGAGLNFSIENSYSISNITSASIDYSGGLIGSLDGRKCLANWSIKNSYAISTINGSSEVGGLIGYILNTNINSGIIENSYAISSLYYNGLVHYQNSGFGGLIGNYYGKNDTLNNSFAETIIYSNSSNNTGGLIGTHSIDYGQNMLIYNSYYRSTPVYGCYSDMNDSNCTQVTDSMYFKDDVTPDQPFSSWDFNNVWQEKANDYPVLKWQNAGNNFDSMNITNCSTIVKPNRIYTFNNNITIPKLTSCFSINASNTTIDLNGNTIGYAEYNNSNGISLITENIFNMYYYPKASNLTIIKNGIIKNSRIAIRIPAESYNWIISNISFYNNRIAIRTDNQYPDNYTNHLFTNNYIDNYYISNLSSLNASWGIIAGWSSLEDDFVTNVTIKNNIINNTYIGILMDYGNTKTRLINNTIINGYYGIETLQSFSGDEFLENNKIYNNKRGLYWYMNFNNTFLNNEIYNNSNYNIYFRTLFGSYYLGNFVYNNSYGKIAYPLNLTLEGSGLNYYVYNDIQLGNTINISNNSAIVIGNKNSSSFPNFTANITLKGLKTTYLYPTIKRDRIYVCNATTSPSCYNFTGLNTGTVIFNVSSWSSYSIEELDILKINITSPTPDYYPLNYNISINYSITNYDLSSPIDTCWYNIQKFDGSYLISNTTLPNCEPTNISISNEGLYNLNLFANSTNYPGYIATNNVNFGISKIAVQLINPNNNQYFNRTNNININFTASSSISIYSCELWGNWSGGFNKNYTFNSVISGQQNNVNYNLPEGIYYWNAMCKDSFGVKYWALNDFYFGVDTTTPSPVINNIATSTGSQTINADVSSGDASPNICKYTITDLNNTIDGLNNNVTYPCNSLFSATVTKYGTFNLSVYVEDKAGHSNSTNSLFTVSASITPAQGGGETSNRVTIQIVTQRISENLTFYPDLTDVTLSKGSKVPREKSINIINKNIQSAEVTLSCIENIEVKTSGNICDYVKFDMEKVVVSSNQQSGTEVKFYVTTPPNANFGDNYAFIIVGTYLKPNNATEFLKASVTASVPGYGILLKSSDIPGTNKTYPVAVFAGIISLVIFIIALVLLAKRYPISAFFIALILFLISFIVLLLWL
jgi:hypothetical protein